MYSELVKPKYRPINIFVMEAQINHPQIEKEIQVYKNDFFSGIVMLTKKLFML